MNTIETGLIYVIDLEKNVIELKDQHKSTFISDIIAKTCDDALPIDCELLQGSTLLQRNLTLLDAGVPFGSTLTLIERQIKIFVQNDAGVIRPIAINRSNTLGYLKKRILDSEEIDDVKTLQLVYQSENLEGNKTLANYNIYDGVTIKYSSPPAAEPRPKRQRVKEDIGTIIINFQNDKTLELPVKRSETIINILARCSDHVNEINCDLIYEGRPLSHNLTIAETGINFGSRFKFLISRVTFVINITFGQKAKITFAIPYSSFGLAKVKDIKDLIFRNRQIPPYQQQLTFGQTPLECEKYLKFYKITTLSSLELQLSSRDRNKCCNSPGHFKLD